MCLSAKEEKKIKFIRLLVNLTVLGRQKMEFRLYGDGGSCCISQASHWDPQNTPSKKGGMVGRLGFIIDGAEDAMQDFA